MAMPHLKQIQIILLLTACIAAIYGFGFYLFPAVVESIRIDIPFSYTALGIVASLGQIGFLVGGLMAGVLTLRFGAVPIVLTALALSTIGLAGLAIANNITIIGLCLFLLGSAAAATWVAVFTILSSSIANKHRAKALGLTSSGTSYGVFVNSLLLTWLLSTEGWRTIWGVAAFIALVLFLIAWFYLRAIHKNDRQEAAKKDKANSSFNGSFNSTKLSLSERFASLPKKLVAMIMLMLFLNGLSCISYQTYLSAFVEGEAGYDKDTSAYVWRLLGLVGMVSGFAIGALADKITVRWTIIITCMILAASALALIKSSDSNNINLLFLAAVTFGISFYSIFGLVPSYISKIFATGDATIIFAFGNFALGLGGIVGNMMGGALKDSLGSFQPIYIIILTVAVLSAILGFIMPNENHMRSSQT